MGDGAGCVIIVLGSESKKWASRHLLHIRLGINPGLAFSAHNYLYLQEAQLSLTNRAMLVCKVVEVWQDFLSEYVDKKFSYICYRRLIRHE